MDWESAQASVTMHEVAYDLPVLGVCAWSWDHT